MKYIDDLSYSGVVNLVQGDNDAASHILDTCAFELKEVREKIAKKEHELNNLKHRERSLLTASHYVAKHLKKELPLAAIRQGYMVVVSTENLTIERNVI